MRLKAMIISLISTIFFSGWPSLGHTEEKLQKLNDGAEMEILSPEEFETKILHSAAAVQFLISPFLASFSKEQFFSSLAAVDFVSKPGREDVFDKENKVSNRAKITIFSGDKSLSAAKQIFEHFMPHEGQSIKSSIELKSKLFNENPRSNCLYDMESMLALGAIFTVGDENAECLFGEKEFTVGVGKGESVTNQHHHDYSGIELFLQGAHRVLGQPVYLAALDRRNEALDNREYQGQNSIISHITEDAVDDFVDIGGWGAKASKPHFPGPNSSLKKEINRLDGVSEIISTYWQVRRELEDKPGTDFRVIRLNSKIKKLRKKIELIPAHRPSTLRGRLVELEEEKSNLLKNGSIRAESLIDRPFFNETRLGTKDGDRSLADWVRFLYNENPRVPYKIFGYDYGFRENTYDRYLDCLERQ